MRVLKSVVPLLCVILTSFPIQSSSYNYLQLSLLQSLLLESCQWHLNVNEMSQRTQRQSVLTYSSVLSYSSQCFWSAFIPFIISRSLESSQSVICIRLLVNSAAFVSLMYTCFRNQEDVVVSKTTMITWLLPSKRLSLLLIMLILKEKIQQLLINPLCLFSLF